MNGRIYTVGGLALGAVLLVALHIFSTTALTGLRLDLTENGLFSLSEGTRNVLESLDEPITLRLFLSEREATRLAGIASYAARVRELLDEYQYVAGGKLIVTLIDPEPFSEEEDRAVGYGLRGIPIDDESVFYFGLVGTNSTDGQEVIPFLTTEREEFIEYDLTRMIQTLANPERKVLGLLTTLPLNGMSRQAMMTGRPGQPWMVMDQMSQLFAVREIDPASGTIDEDVDVLMVVHPKGFSDRMLYAIDQFVLGGGHALVFVDPYPEADESRPSAMGMMMPPTPSDLGPLLEAWGVSMTAGSVVGDLQLAVPVRTEREGRAVQLNYPVWMNVPPALLNPDDVVTGKLGNLTFATPGRLTPVNGASITMTTLVESTDGAMTIDPARLGPQSDPEDLLRDYKPGGEKLVLAARIGGTARSAFPDGPPPAEQGGNDGAPPKSIEAGKSAAKTEHLAESKGDINVIVVGDTDILRDHFWVRVQELMGTRLAIPTAANGTFVINALDNLAGSDDLISVRSHGHFLRPFTRINAMREAAELRFREKEQALLDRLEQTERKLTEMENGKTRRGNSLVLSEAQREEIARFREERVRVRKELRVVRHELRSNIETLEASLKLMDIALVPVLIILGGLIVGIHRLRRPRGSAGPAHAAP